MIKDYLIKVIHNRPYPVVNSYRTKGVRMSVAVKRALDQFHQENKGRIIDEIKINAMKL